MGDIAKGVLGGAWTLLVGWILPTALNLSVFWFGVAPSLRHAPLAARLWPTTGSSGALLLLAMSILLGLVLAALQSPLYRVLEGYLLWPSRSYDRGCARHLRSKHDLQDRLALLRLARREEERVDQPSRDDAAELARLRTNSRIARAARKDQRRTPVQRSLIREKLARYPVDDGQIAPTRLGNAIRRFEEYGHDRFRLDTQVLWNELTGTAPEQVRRQVDLARASVDFFVSLLSGHAVIAVAAAAALFAPNAHVVALLVSAVVLGCLMPLWYRAAIAATDEWAAAVRALVNVGRKPLAESLGLALPSSLEGERAMWALVTKLSRLPYHERATALDVHRVGLPSE
ncbi:hypothetical protein [Streptomyces sp. BE230]|uniref:hypothetical protein n=1 Tax=Streptomyces sp. BE230 TaxID=3002526 RepID=UPI002ED65E69|nr:hypothetical protein [Streptomyces sp. BE230]